MVSKEVQDFHSPKKEDFEIFMKQKIENSPNQSFIHKKKGVSTSMHLEQQNAMNWKKFEGQVSFNLQKRQFGIESRASGNVDFSSDKKLINKRKENDQFLFANLSLQTRCETYNQSISSIPCAKIESDISNSEIKLKNQQFTNKTQNLRNNRRITLNGIFGFQSDEIKPNLSGFRKKLQNEQWTSTLEIQNLRGSCKITNEKGEAQSVSPSRVRVPMPVIEEFKQIIQSEKIEKEKKAPNSFKALLLRQEKEIQRLDSKIDDLSKKQMLPRLSFPTNGLQNIKLIESDLKSFERTKSKITEKDYHSISCQLVVPKELLQNENSFKQSKQQIQGDSLKGQSSHSSGNNSNNNNISNSNSNNNSNNNSNKTTIILSKKDKIPQDKSIAKSLSPESISSPQISIFASQEERHRPPPIIITNNILDKAKELKLFSQVSNGSKEKLLSLSHRGGDQEKQVSPDRSARYYLSLPKSPSTKRISVQSEDEGQMGEKELSELDSPQRKLFSLQIRSLSPTKKTNIRKSIQQIQKIKSQKPQIIPLNSNLESNMNILNNFYSEIQSPPRLQDNSLQDRNFTWNNITTIDSAVINMNNEKYPNISSSPVKQQSPLRKKSHKETMSPKGQFPLKSHLTSQGYLNQILQKSLAKKVDLSMMKLKPVQSQQRAMKSSKKLRGEDSMSFCSRTNITSQESQLDYNCSFAVVEACVGLEQALANDQEAMKEMKNNDLDCPTLAFYFRKYLQEAVQFSISQAKDNELNAQNQSINSQQKNIQGSFVLFRVSHELFSRLKIILNERLKGNKYKKEILNACESCKNWIQANNVLQELGNGSQLRELVNLIVQEIRVQTNISLLNIMDEEARKKVLEKVCIFSEVLLSDQFFEAQQMIKSFLSTEPNFTLIEFFLLKSFTYSALIPQIKKHLVLSILEKVESVRMYILPTQGDSTVFQVTKNPSLYKSKFNLLLFQLTQKCQVRIQKFLKNSKHHDHIKSNQDKAMHSNSLYSNQSLISSAVGQMNPLQNEVTDSSYYNYNLNTSKKKLKKNNNTKIKRGVSFVEYLQNKKAQNDSINLTNNERNSFYEKPSIRNTTLQNSFSIVLSNPQQVPGCIQEVQFSPPSLKIIQKNSSLTIKPQQKNESNSEMEVMQTSLSKFSQEEQFLKTHDTFDQQDQSNNKTSSLKRILSQTNFGTEIQGEFLKLCLKYLLTEPNIEKMARIAEIQLKDKRDFGTICEIIFELLRYQESVEFTSSILLTAEVRCLKVKILLGLESNYYGLFHDMKQDLLENLREEIDIFCQTNSQKLKVSDMKSSQDTKFLFFLVDIVFTSYDMFNAEDIAIAKKFFSLSNEILNVQMKSLHKVLLNQYGNTKSAPKVDLFISMLYKIIDCDKSFLN